MADRSTFIINLKAIGFDKVADGFRKVADKAKMTFQNLGKVQKNQQSIKSNKVKKLGDDSAKTAKQVKGMTDGLLLMGNSLKGLVILGVSKLASEFVGLADEFNHVRDQMERFTGSSERAAELTDKLQKASIDTGSSLGILSTAFNKISIGLSQFGHSEEELIDVTKGMALVFSDAGVEADKLADITGNLASMFTRATLPFDKFESLFTGANQEEVFKKISDELVKISGIDLTSFANKGKNAMAIIETEVKKGTISVKDLRTAFINVGKARLDEGIVPTQIRHGVDQLTQSFTVLLTKFNESTGLSTTLAELLHNMSRIVKDLSDNIHEVKKAIVAIGIAALTGLTLKLAGAILGVTAQIGFLNAALTITARSIKSVFVASFVGIVAVLITDILDNLGLFDSKVKEVTDNVAKNAEAAMKKIRQSSKDLFTAGGLQADANFGTALQTGAGVAGATTKLPQLTAAESAIKSLSDKLKNLRDSVNIVNLSADKRIQLEAEIHRQAQDLLVTHGTELSEKGKLLDATKDIIKETKAYSDAEKVAIKTKEKAKKATEDLEKAQRDYADYQERQAPASSL